MHSPPPKKKKKQEKKKTSIMSTDSERQSVTYGDP